MAIRKTKDQPPSSSKGRKVKKWGICGETSFGGMAQHFPTISQLTLLWPPMLLFFTGILKNNKTTGRLLTLVCSGIMSAGGACGGVLFVCGLDLVNSSGGVWES